MIKFNILPVFSYARGILFGKMVMELGDDSLVKCESQNLTCDLEFKTKVKLTFQFLIFPSKSKANIL